jgi:hypothetical protein
MSGNAKELSKEARTSKPPVSKSEEENRDVITKIKGGICTVDITAPRESRRPLVNLDEENRLGLFVGLYLLKIVHEDHDIFQSLTHVFAD